MNPIDSGPANIITVGLGACSKTFQELLEALEKGNKMFQKFVETKFLKKSKRYFFTSYTTKYRDRNKIARKLPRVISVLKENI